MSKARKAIVIILVVALLAVLAYGLLCPDSVLGKWLFSEPDPVAAVVEGERYSSPDDVAAYINLYGKLPPNFITKSEAQRLGWVSTEGNLWDVTDRMSIGGDSFGNREGLLPDADGRRYYECDVNYSGGYRGSERLIYSNDGLIYYTNDHYETFELLYGEG